MKIAGGKGQRIALGAVIEADSGRALGTCYAGAQKAVDPVARRFRTLLQKRIDGVALCVTDRTQDLAEAGKELLGVLPHGGAARQKLDRVEKLFVSLRTVFSVPGLAIQAIGCGRQKQHGRLFRADPEKGAPQPVAFRRCQHLAEALKLVEDDKVRRGRLETCLRKKAAQHRQRPRLGLCLCGCRDAFAKTRPFTLRIEARLERGAEGADKLRIDAAH